MLRIYKWNPGRFPPITCSPRKVSRFAPLNRYYIIIVEVFFDNVLLIIYLIVVCKKKVIIHSFWSTFVKDLNRNFSGKIFKKPYKNSKKVSPCTNAKVHEMTKMLYKCANNLFFNELRIKC